MGEEKHMTVTVCLYFVGLSELFIVCVSGVCVCMCVCVSLSVLVSLCTRVCETVILMVYL